MNRLLPFLTLFTSASTLLCCALPAAFVALGAGVTFAGLLDQVPQLIWISEHKPFVFGMGALFLTLGGYTRWRARTLPCPTDPKLAAACTATRRWSLVTYFASVALYLVGVSFAYLAS